METQQEIKNYADIKKELEPAFPEARRIQLIPDAINKQVVIYGFKEFPSSLAEGKSFVVILADLNGEKVSFNCGEIVLKQLKDLKDKLPIRTTVTRTKGKRYYTLS